MRTSTPAPERGPDAPPHDGRSTPSSSCARRSSWASCRPGTPLRLDELARSLGMSISPIREAVRQLEALGLAKHVPHQGAQASSTSTSRSCATSSRSASRSSRSRCGGRPSGSPTRTPTAPARHLARFDEARAAGRRARGRCGRTRTSISRSTRRRSRSGSSRSIRPGVGPLGALPAGAARVRGRARRTATASSTSALLARVRRARSRRGRRSAPRPPRARERHLRDRARRQGDFREPRGGRTSRLVAGRSLDVRCRDAGAGKSSVTCSRRTPLARCQSGARRITDASNVRRTGCERLGSQHSASPSRSSRWTSLRRLPQARS